MKKQCGLAILAAGLLGACSLGPGSEGFLPKAYDGALRLELAPVVVPDTFPGCVQTATVRVRNIHENLDVRITDVALPDPALSLGVPLPIALGPGEVRSVAVHFTPDRIGTTSGDVLWTTDEGKLHAAVLPLSVRAVERPPLAAAPASPLDLVFVLDVSTSMSELSRLRGAIAAVLDEGDGTPRDVRIGLTTFENSVRVHGGGAFLGRGRFFEEFDAQLVGAHSTPDPLKPRQALNFDFPENILDALGRAATEFDYRDDARRYIVLMTDDTFREPPAVFSDGTAAIWAYADVARSLRERKIRLFAVHEPLRGRGLSSPHVGADSLVQQAGGAWFEIADVDRGRLPLDGLIADLVAGRTCP